MKIGVIGSGYVGLVTGTCFAHLGNEVVCVDNNPQKIAQLKKGVSPIYEPGLSEMIKQHLKDKRLKFTLSIAEAVAECEVLFICVNTPPKENGEADLSFVENVSQAIAKNMKSYRLIVEKSTVPVETGFWVQKTVKMNLRKGVPFDIASNPEFLREGSAISDFLNPDRIVIGVQSKKAETILRKLYKPLKAPLLVTDLKSAELIKHASNSFLATKISFINMVARVCDAVGADVDQVSKGMGLDPRIGTSFLRAGIGFGGFCFPKDLAAFLSMSDRVGHRFELLQEVLNINESQQRYFVQKIRDHLWNLKGKTLGVLGLAFKADTDDMRFAPSIQIIQELQEEGVQVRAFDPQAMSRARAELKKVVYVKNPYDAARNADALLVLTEWKEFSSLDFLRIKKLMRHPVLFDARNFYEPSAVKKLGFRYYAIGRGAEDSK